MHYPHDGLLYLSNETKFTAEIISSMNAKGDIVVPNSSYYNSHDFIITKISQNSFNSNYSIRSIRFHENSKLKVIEQNAFYNSFLSSLEIPASVEDLHEGWCDSTKKLNHVSVMGNNKRYKSIGGKIILGKSDPNNINYDHLVFASRNITNCNIPPYIKHIDSYAFKECQNLQSIIFPENSQLLSIGRDSFSMSFIVSISIPDSITQIRKCTFALCQKLQTVTFSKSSKLEKIEESAFCYTSIEEITIPPHVKTIEMLAFSNCCKLRSFQFSEGSEISQIESSTFSDSSIEELHIPSKVNLLKEGWCAGLMKLKHIFLSPENENFSYLNKNVILGKSDLVSNIFDVLVCACSETEEVFVPSSIKNIDSYAFQLCKKLKKIEFEENSKLIKIGTKSFADSSIRRIVVPRSVEEIGVGAFFGCSELKKIEFEPDTKLNQIDQKALAYSSVEGFIVPAMVEKIQDDTFEECENLKTIEILGNLDFNLGNMLKTVKKISLISFPNSNEILVGNVENVSVSDNFRLFTCPGARMNIFK